jgi:hypothetical protein
VREAVRMLSRRPANERRIVLLVSETRDHSSEGRTREILAETQIHNVNVYSVNVNRFVTTLTAKPQAPRPDPIPATARRLPGYVATTPGTVSTQLGGATSGNVIPLFVEIFKDVKDLFVANPAEVFTKFTGGREYSFTDVRGLENAITDIGAELHSQYVITYDPDNKIEGGLHEIKVVVTKPEAANWDIRHRVGYWMAAVPE